MLELGTSGSVKGEGGQPPRLPGTYSRLSKAYRFVCFFGRYKSTKTFRNHRTAGSW
jgi:hypothetical protein